MREINVEIGGYLELEIYHGQEYHPSAIALNSGRNCLSYLIEARKIKKIHLPVLICSSVIDVCKRHDLEIQFYPINEDFSPRVDKLDCGDGTFYLVNYYGQLSTVEQEILSNRFDHIIIDNAQAFFQSPKDALDTVYTCRKFFGVPDGAYLYTDAFLGYEIKQDVSYSRMSHLLGRFEAGAQAHYAEFVENERIIDALPLRSMSKLTHNLLRGIDYQWIKERREENFRYLHEHLKDKNRLQLNIPEGPFAYPLLIEHGAEIRKALQQQKIYIPTLWPNVLEIAPKGSLEYEYAANLLPLPCDQRFTIDDGIRALQDALIHAYKLNCD